MKKRFRLTPEAQADLREILLDIADASQEAAERLRKKLYEAFSLLGKSPGIGHYHEEFLDRRYRLCLAAPGPDHCRDSRREGFEGFLPGRATPMRSTATPADPRVH